MQQRKLQNVFLKKLFQQQRRKIISEKSSERCRPLKFIPVICPNKSAKIYSRKKIVPLK